MREKWDFVEKPVVPVVNCVSCVSHVLVVDMNGKVKSENLFPFGSAIASKTPRQKTVLHIVCT